MTLIEKIGQLPPEARKEAEDFVDFLTLRHPQRNHHVPTLSWAGCLKESDGHKTSVELQHEIYRERAENTD